MKTDDTMLQEIAALRAMDTTALIAKYTELFGKPPRVKNREALWKRCAWKVQEARSGGLSESAKSKLEELIAQIDLPLGESQRSVAGVLAPTRTARTGALSVGTTLTRTWHDQTIEVRVVEGGFEFGGIVYKSLSATAKAITGQHWNGPLFFGLVARKKEKAK